MRDGPVFSYVLLVRELPKIYEMSRLYIQSYFYFYLVILIWKKPLNIKQLSYRLFMSISFTTTIILLNYMLSELGLHQLVQPPKTKGKEQSDTLSDAT